MAFFTSLAEELESRARVFASSAHIQRVCGKNHTGAITVFTDLLPFG